MRCHKHLHTFIALELPPIAALWIGNNPSFPLKSICVPPDTSVKIILGFPKRPQAIPKGVSTDNYIINNKITVYYGI